MTHKPDKAKLLEDFMSAAWALTAAEISELDDEKISEIMQSLNSGVSHVRLIVVPASKIVVGAVYDTADGNIPPTELFRCDGNLPSGVSH